MRMTPAERSRARILAARRRDADEAEGRAAASGYETMLLKLDADLQRLSEIRDPDRKIALKRELLGDYDAWVQGALANPAPSQDLVLVTMLVWRIDTGDLEGALELFRHAYAHNMRLPERITRDLPTFVLEEIAEAALKERTVNKRLSDATLGVLIAVHEAVANEDLHAKPRAKAEKAIGFGLADEESAPRAVLERALGHLKRALHLDETCGVKGEIARLEKRLAALDPEETAPEAA